MEEITLGSTEFKALASETRTNIVKLLGERNHTLSELSKKTTLAAPTVKQHLAILEGAGLIAQIDEGRKWKYYSLTKKGKKILTPGTSATVLIVLGISLIGIVSVVYGLMSRLAMQPIAIFQESGIADAGKDFAAGAGNAVLEKAIAEAPALSGAVGQLPFVEIMPLLIALLAFLALLAIFLPKAIKMK